MNRFIITFCFVLLSGSLALFAQKNINSYKYVIVPEQYEFQKEADQHQINSLVKFLFEKYGFTVLSTNEAYPEDLAKNPCMALKGMVKKESAFLMTKVKVNLVDCYNNVIYSSSDGKSKEKDFKKSYHEAIREAFTDIDSLNYTYNGSVVQREAVVAKNQQPITPAISEVKTQDEVTVTEQKQEKITKEPKPIKVEEVKPPTKVVETAVVVSPAVKPKKEEKQVKSYSLEGTYFIDMWGKCVIAKKGDGYSVVGGDEDFEFATISKTSKSTLFMVKKTGFKQTQLLELNSEGNLQIDSNNGVKIYKRIN